MADACLSPDESARAAQFVFARDRIRYQMGRATLREILGVHLGCRSDAVVFGYGPNGKPAVPGVQFNLSHSANLACLALHPDVILGVDVEQVRPIEHAVAQRFFSRDEISALNALPPDMWLAGFYRCRTRKEAVVKQLGDGLSYPLDAFSVSLAPGAHPEMTQIDPDYGTCADWQFAHFDAGSDFVGAVTWRGAQRVPVDVVSQPDNLKITLSASG